MDDAAKRAMRARALVEQGRLQRDGGDLTAAAGSYARAAELWRGVDAAKLAHTLRHVADIAREDGKMEVAWAAIDEVLAMYRERRPDGLEMGNALRVAALVQEARGERVAAVELWREALPLYDAAGVKAGVKEGEKRIKSLGSS